MSTDLDEQENRLLIVIFANSRSFSLTHDAHSENEIQSSFSKKEFHILAIFFWFAYFYKWFDDFLLICVFLQMIWRFSFKHSRISTNDEDIVSTRFFYEQLTIFFYLAYFYEIDDFILFIRVSRRAICFDRTFDECQLVSQNSEREIVLCCKQWIIVIADWKKLRWRRHRRKLKNFVLKM